MYRGFASLVLLAACLAGCSQQATVHFRDALTQDAIPGWQAREGDPAAWSVKDGILSCTGKGGGYLSTPEEYTDFIIDLEWKLSEGGNSGVFIRVPPQGNPVANAMEVQILDDHAQIHRKIEPWQHCGSLYHIAPAARDAAAPIGEWNRMRIKCDGDHIVVVLNDQTLVDANARTHPEIAQRSSKGTIALQNHGTPLWFRNIRIADLSVVGKSAPKQQASAKGPA